MWRENDILYFKGIPREVQLHTASEIRSPWAKYLLPPPGVSRRSHGWNSSRQIALCALAYGSGMALRKGHDIIRISLPSWECFSISPENKACCSCRVIIPTGRVGVLRVKCQRRFRSESGVADAAAHCAQETNTLEDRTLKAQGDGNFPRACAKGQGTAVPRL